MLNKLKKLKKLAIYNPQTITALTVFLSGPRTKMRKGCIVAFNAFYYMGKLAKKWKHRHDNNFALTNRNIKWPDVSETPIHKVAVIIAELSIPQCKMYRVDNKVKLLEKLGYRVYVASWQDSAKALTYLQLADFVIFYRVPFFPIVKTYYQEAERLHLTRFYDVDDLIFDVPLYKQYLNQSHMEITNEFKELLNGAKLYREAIIHSDVFLTSTAAIKQIYETIADHKQAYILPNGISDSILEIRNELTKKTITEDVSLFYGAGSKTHDADFDLISQAVANILRNYPQTHLYVIGQLKLNPIFDEFSDQIHRISRLSAENYFREITNYDIALMPLTDNFFNKCKSNIKFIEASTLNIPSVASDIDEFSQVITNGENGFLAANEQEWYEKIEQLILHTELRAKFAQNAYQTCKRLYGKENQSKELEKILIQNNILPFNFQSRQHNSILRILQVNLHYGIDSIGGATVVVENLATQMNLIDKENIKVAVFTTHRPDSAGEGVLRKYSFNHVDVYSCATNVNEMYDLENDAVNSAFSLVLKTFKPDLVHFHAVQGFGYGIGKICKKYNVPYVMTLHDNWPLCPKLFMVDSAGEHCEKFGLSVGVCENRCDLSADWIATRRHQTYRLLQNAAQLYVPSFYARKTLQRLIPDFQYVVNKNGIENFTGKTANRENRGKIRFLFVAGEAEVKGFKLIYHALMNLLEYDWELVLLMPLGTPKTKWPSGRLKVLGRQNREQMKNLYKKIDVLLFPSLGYESFGLTVREAISSDCFVIVSDCGGPAEAVIDGENGIIVPRGDEISLKNAIEEVLKTPIKYINYRTQNYGDIRSYREQAKEMVHFYTKII